MKLHLEPGLLMPIGSPASGKSTLAKKLIEGGLDPAAVVGWDAIRAEVCPNKPCQCEDASPECPGAEECYCRSGLVYYLATSRMEKLAQAGSFFYVDGLNLKPSRWKDVVDLAKSNNLKASALLLEVLPLPTLVLRNSSRDRQVPEEFLKTTRNQHKSIKPDLILERGFDYVHSVNDLTEFTL